MHMIQCPFIFYIYMPPLAECIKDIITFASTLMTLKSTYQPLMWYLKWKPPGLQVPGLKTKEIRCSLWRLSSPQACWCSELTRNLCFFETAAVWIRLICLLKGEFNCSYGGKKAIISGGVWVSQTLSLLLTFSHQCFSTMLPIIYFNLLSVNL